MVLSMQFGIALFVEVQETYWRGNLQGSKCNGDFMFSWKLFSFYERVAFHLDLVGVFLKYVTPTFVVMFSTDLHYSYAVRKTIFACLFSVHNTVSLHVMNMYI